MLGAGAIAQAIARHAIRHGREVVLSNSRGPDRRHRRHQPVRLPFLEPGDRRSGRPHRERIRVLPASRRARSRLSTPSTRSSSHPIPASRRGGRCCSSPATTPTPRTP
ncbi:NAD(P)-binding domain-containing protein [Streptomyces sp. PRh5]|uniref:NAD(P)-binding domain-containing protein n=1 Tax=Streptomyces sp. PRh5 TaxID=1158056 RepID=UPI001F528935|nr:NAD(P)-binding domain-containing protein [Streptomyces sp. PRh5]